MDQGLPCGALSGAGGVCWVVVVLLASGRLLSSAGLDCGFGREAAAVPASLLSAG
jgi:hypothetical protein